MIAFLVIADDPEQLMLVSAMLHRKFPNAIVQTCRDSDAALEVARSQTRDAIVAHRTSDMDELPLVESLRAATTATILLVSGEHHEATAFEVGAINGFSLGRPSPNSSTLIPHVWTLNRDSAKWPSFPRAIAQSCP